jgi:Ca-activated chloride channel family protein
MKLTATLSLLFLGVAARADVTQGQLVRVGLRHEMVSECPLKHTDVKADVTGFIGRVTVTQDFVNNASDKIEAVYVFPLPPNSAVSDMSMLVGDRHVKGTIKRREEARAIYEAAVARGQVAGLLDQERPNIFTQSVANIMPGAKVRITISYVQTLKYEDGNYNFVFPMVVGPRYIPRSTPDAARISPPVTAQGTRAGHDISIELNVDAGVPLDAINCLTHEVTTTRPSASRAVIRLKDNAVLPNKDFIVKYDVADRKIEDTVLTHRGSQGGFFTLILQPPERVRVEEVTPKELVFVLDTSGSMMGFPIEKAKESMRYALDGLNPRDTFNLITFSGDTHILFPGPVQAMPENLAIARRFLETRSGSGGTEMMKAIRASLEGTHQQDHVRVVCFMTDGYVGNEDEIIREIRSHPNARIFSFGIGSAVNHYLLDKMAEYGKGEVDYVGLQDDGSAAARRFHERVRNPLLTDITVEYSGLQVTDVFPNRVPDLFSAKPVVITGRYDRAGEGTITLRGNLAGKPYKREIAVEFPNSEPKHDVLATLWARTKVDALMHGDRQFDAREEITKLGLDYHLMTPFTSFVAVEEMTITDGGQPRRVEVPLEMPAGVSYEGVYGEAPAAQYAPAAMVQGVVGGTPSFFPRRAMIFGDSVEVRPAAPRITIDPALNGRTGKVDVRVSLKDVTADAIKQLKALGFEVFGQPSGAKIVLGRISAEKLQALSKLTFVTYIAAM